MILYNGVALESIGDVKIEDINVSPIQFNPVARQRAIRYGSDFVRMVGGTRTITINFALLEENPVVRQEAFIALTTWAKTDKEYKLELPQDPARYLMCICTSKPDKSVRKWWEKMRLVFTCFNDPYWISKAEKTAACGAQFVALGDGVPIMRIERTLSAAASNQSYSDGTNTMTFSTIPAGNMVIDLNEQAAKVGNTDIMQYYQPSGRFVIPKIGAQTITGTGSVKFRERWE